MTRAENVALHIERGVEQGDLSPSLALKYALELIYLMNRSHQEPAPASDPEAHTKLEQLNSRLIKKLGW